MPNWHFVLSTCTKSAAAGVNASLMIKPDPHALAKPPSETAGEPGMTTQALSKRERLPIARGWIVLGFVALSWIVLALCIIGFWAVLQLFF